MSSRGQLAGDRRNRELSAFSFCLGKNQGQTQEWQFAAGQLESAAIRYAGKRKGPSRDGGEEARGFA